MFFARDAAGLDDVLGTELDDDDTVAVASGAFTSTSDRSILPAADVFGTLEAISGLGVVGCASNSIKSSSKQPFFGMVASTGAADDGNIAFACSGTEASESKSSSAAG